MSLQEYKALLRYALPLWGFTSIILIVVNRWVYGLSNFAVPAQIIYGVTFLQFIVLHKEIRAWLHARPWWALAQRLLEIVFLFLLFLTLPMFSLPGESLPIAEFSGFQSVVIACAVVASALVWLRRPGRRRRSTTGFFAGVLLVTAGLFVGHPELGGFGLIGLAGVALGSAGIFWSLNLLVPHVD